MRCKRCHSVLNLVRTEKSHTSVQLWYECPMCWHNQFVSAPVEKTYQAWSGDLVKSVLQRTEAVA